MIFLFLLISSSLSLTVLHLKCPHSKHTLSYESELLGTQMLIFQNFEILIVGELKVDVILTISVTPKEDLTNEKTVYYQELFNNTFSMVSS